MTADAKVGLLLGLVFIVLIAFLINGLPGFFKTSPSSLVSNTMKEGTETNLVINEKAGEVLKTLESPVIRETPATAKERAMVSLQESKPVLEEPKPAAPSAETQAAGPNPSKSMDIEPVKAEEKPMDTERAKPVTPVRTYVVQPGDNLSKIAVAMYGTELGNKMTTVQALYEANKDKMKTASDILPGKTLVIPDLAPLKPASTVSASTSTKPAVKVGEKPATKTTEKATTTKPAGKTTKPKPANPDPGAFEQVKKKPVSQASGESYRVKPGENLWTIAQKQLGDGNRYHEIMALNASVLRKPDDIRSQMNLKLPKR